MGSQRQGWLREISGGTATVVSDFKAKFSQRGGLPAWDASISMGYASLAMAKGDTKRNNTIGAFWY